MLQMRFANMKDYNTINIVGNGFVGSSCGYLCQKNNITYNMCDVKIDQKIETCWYQFFTNEIRKLVEWSENENENNINYYFICVPTPSDETGECDISIVESVISDINKMCRKQTFIIVKSTLVPGTCRMFSEKYKNVDIVLSPEFLTEKNCFNDMYNAKYVLLGMQDVSLNKYQQLLRLFRDMYKHNYDLDIYTKTFEECELFKYTLNTYLATKITFFNEIYELADKIGVDYQSLKTMFELDSRIGKYGTQVPGTGNTHRGFFLSCLPKEVKGMIKLQEKLGLSNELMKCVDTRNAYFNQQVAKTEQ